MGANSIARYLDNQGIKKLPRQNGKNPLFNADLITRILKTLCTMGK